MEARGLNVNCGGFGSGRSSDAMKVVLPAVEFHLQAWSARGISVAVGGVSSALSNHHPRLHDRLVACQGL